MAVSSGFFAKLKRQEQLEEDIKQQKHLIGLSGLISPAVFHFASGIASNTLNMALGPLAGLTVGISSALKKRQMAKLFKPGEIDESYSQQELEDCSVLDRMSMGLAMQLDDFKSGHERYKKRTGLAGAISLKSYLVARANDFFPFYIKDDYLTRHMSFIGATGVGKTEAQLAMLQQSIARGGGGIMIEMKGDGSLPARAYQLAKAYGAEKRFRLITLDNVKISQKYNPVFNTDTRSAISTIMSLLSANGEQFHKDVAKWGLSVAITVITGQLSKPKYTLQDLALLIGDIEVFHEYFEKMPTRTKDEIAAKIFCRDFFEQFKKVNFNTGEVGWDTSNYSQRMMGVKAALQSFAYGDFAEVLCTVEPDLKLTDAIENGEIIVLSANTLKDSEGVATFGRLFMADLAVAIGEIQSKESKPLIPFPIWLDEYASFKNDSHKKLFQLARSANIGLIIGVQGKNFLSDGPEGETFAKNVLANCWNHVFYDIRDDTRKFAAEMAGTIIREMEQSSDSETRGHGYDKSQGNIVGNISTGKSKSTGTKQTREDQIQPEDLMLDAGDALWVGKYETYRVRLPFVNFKSPKPDLNQEFIYFEKFKTENVKDLGLFEKMAKTV
jgi:hypothetical protein